MNQVELRRDDAALLEAMKAEQTRQWEERDTKPWAPGRRAPVWFSANEAQTFQEGRTLGQTRAALARLTAAGCLQKRPMHRLTMWSPGGDG